jgi:hypothetical protein
MRIYFNTLKFIHKIVAGNAPEYMKKYLTERKEKHDYDLRRKSDFDRPRFRKRTTQNSFLFKGIGLYNDLNNELNKKNEMFGNENDFKRKLNSFVKDKIKPLCEGNLAGQSKR